MTKLNKISQIFLLIGYILAFVGAGFLTFFSIFYFVASERTSLVAPILGVSEATAAITCIVYGFILLFEAIVSLLAGIFGYKARNDSNKIFYVLTIVFGAISGIGFLVAGAIISIISLNNAKEQSSKQSRPVINNQSLVENHSINESIPEKSESVTREVYIPDHPTQSTFDYQNGKVILSVRHLKQYFRFGRGQFKYTKAVHDVSFDVYKGEVFGLVGESGCGKTTTGRSIIKLYRLTSGDVWFKGVRIAAGTRWNEKEIKFTNIRLREALKELKNKEKEELNLLKLSYQDKEDGNKEDYEKQVKAIKDKYAALRKEKIEPAEEIVSTQREKIKKAKHDDRHCNDDIAKAAVARVKAKYDDLFHPENLVNKAKANPDSEESKEILKRYEEYKKKLKEAKNASITRSIQMIFQDPIASLNPRMTIRNIIAEGLIIRGVKDKAFIDKEVKRVLELVGLLPEHANRYPHEFSGGQRQRIGIARAIIMKPELIIADEPVSALDVSIQAQVINLLNDLRNDLGLTILFIAHNLSVVKYFCDRIAVMYYGNLMEVATSDELFKHPLHPYTKSLLSAVPHPDPNTERTRTRIVYNPMADHDYSQQGPTIREIIPGHFVRCNDEEEKRYLKEIKKIDSGK